MDVATLPPLVARSNASMGSAVVSGAALVIGGEPVASAPAVSRGAANDQPAHCIRLVIPRAPDARVRVESVIRGGAYPGASLLLSLSPIELCLRHYRGDVARAVAREIRHRITMLEIAADALEGQTMSLPLDVVDRRPVQGCMGPVAQVTDRSASLSREA